MQPFSYIVLRLTYIQSWILELDRDFVIAHDQANFVSYSLKSSFNQRHNLVPFHNFLTNKFVVLCKSQNLKASRRIFIT